jgi:hypothetical protein
MLAEATESLSKTGNGQTMKLFLDTDALIDFFGGQAAHGEPAQRLALLDLFEDAELWVSPKSFTDIDLKTV